MLMIFMNMLHNYFTSKSAPAVQVLKYRLGMSSARSLPTVYLQLHRKQAIQPDQTMLVFMFHLNIFLSY